MKIQGEVFCHALKDKDVKGIIIEALINREMLEHPLAISTYGYNRANQFYNAYRATLNKETLTRVFWTTAYFYNSGLLLTMLAQGMDYKTIFERFDKIIKVEVVPPMYKVTINGKHKYKVIPKGKFEERLEYSPWYVHDDVLMERK